MLGIVQGLTEFLPISSTGHLRIVPAFLGWEDPGAAFTAVTQLGTMAAVLLYFRADLMRIALAWLRSVRDRSARRELDARIGWYIVLGTIPIGIFGVLFKDQIENGARDLYLIGTALIVLGLVLLLAEQVGTRERGDRADRGARRPRGRACPGARPGPRRVALGGDDHRRSVPGLDRRGRGALLVPALGAGGGAAAACSSWASILSGEEGSTWAPAARGGDPARLRHRLRGDRLAAALPRPPTRRSSSWSTASRSGCWCWCSRAPGDQIAR